MDSRIRAIGVAASGPLLTLSGAAQGCVEQPDGKVVVVGNSVRNLLAMRFHANGAVDTSFGDQGVFVLVGYDIWVEGGMGIALQNDGAVVLAAKTYQFTSGAGSGSGILVRLTPAGQLDTNFAGTGIKLIQGGDRAFLNSVFVLPDGKILTGGNQPSGIWAARYLADGSADPSFGSQGKSFITQPTQNNNSGQVGRVLPQPDGTVLIMSVGINTSTQEAWVVDRLTPSGTRDTAFTQIKLPYAGTNTRIGSMACLTDGRIAVTIPRFDSAYSAADLIGLYSKDGVPQVTVSNAAFAGARPSSSGIEPEWAMVIRKDGSLWGGRSRNLVQYLPTQQVIDPTSDFFTPLSLTATADGGLLRPMGTNGVKRYSAAGVNTVTFPFSATPSNNYSSDIEVSFQSLRIQNGATANFGTALVNGPASTKALALRNTGLSNLGGLSLSITGTHASEFSVSALPNTTLASGGRMELVFSFAPKGEGTRTAKLVISSDDPDEGSFDLNLTGMSSSLVPQLVVESPGVLTHAGAVSFGTVTVGAQSQPRVFTIRNTGTKILEDIQVNIGNSHPSDFTASALPSSSLAPGASQTFTITFAPKAAGSRLASARFLSTDPDVSPSFFVYLTGSATAPASASEISIEADSPIGNGGSISFGSAEVGSPISRTITIRNLGTANLTGLGISLSGNHSADFSVSGLTSTTIAAGGSLTLTVTFTPQGSSTRSAILRIVSNDSDENPYDLNLGGLGFLSPPKMKIEGVTVSNGINLLSMGAVAINTAPITSKIVIRNTGGADIRGLGLHLDVDSFQSTALTSTTIHPGGSQTLTISFAPTYPGTSLGTLRIYSNVDDNPKVIHLRGSGSPLEMVFTGGSRVSRPFQAVNLGSVTTGTSADRSFTITNTSSEVLNGLALISRGADVADFQVFPSLPASLAPQESFTFTIRFNANLPGPRKAWFQVGASYHTVDLDFSATVKAARLVIRDAQRRAITSAPNKVSFWGETNWSTTALPVISDVKDVKVGDRMIAVLRSDGSVHTWDLNGGSFKVLEGKATSISTGSMQTYALLESGAIAGYESGKGSAYVPLSLSGISFIASSRNLHLAAKSNGQIVSWPSESSTYVLPPTPPSVTSVAGLAVGDWHAVVLKQDGTVVTWGGGLPSLIEVPLNLTNVIAVAAGSQHTLALKADGSVVAWGSNSRGQTDVPKDLANVVAIAAADNRCLALRKDGKLVAWGATSAEAEPPAALSNVTGISIGGNLSAAIGRLVIDLGTIKHGLSTSRQGIAQNVGSEPLAVSQVHIEGPDANAFTFASNALPGQVAAGSIADFTLRFQPRRVGKQEASLKIASNDPETNPFVGDLWAVGTYETTAFKVGTAGKPLTYGPMTFDSSTGLILQKVTFKNPTEGPMNGLAVYLSSVPLGVIVGSSSQNLAKHALEVIYSKPIARGETIQFTLSYQVVNGRATSIRQPAISVEALLDPEPRSEVVDGVLTPLLGVRDTSAGPLVEWTCKPGSIYVVEYSDDGGTTWYSAVHRLMRNGTRLMWVDRGQLETYFKPVNKAARKYRAKMLASAAAAKR